MIEYIREQNYLTQKRDQATDIDYSLIAALVIIVIFEGCAGKWFSLQLEYSLIILRDILAIAIAYRGFRLARSSPYRLSYSLLTAWSVTVVFWALLQNLVAQTPAILILIGFRFWLLYAWTALGICVLLSDQNYERLCALVIKMFCMMLPLVVIQNFSSPESFINRSSGGDDAFVFRIDGNVVRATGTFSFTLGYTCFLALASALALSSSSPQEGRSRSYQQQLLSVTVILSTIVSGSRAAIAFSGFLYISTAILLAFSPRSSKSGAMVLGMVLSAFALLLMPLFFEETFIALNNRILGAAEVEDFSERMITLFLGSPTIHTEMTFLGRGIGLTANVAGFALSGESMFLLAESEPERLLLGGGILGIGYIMVKITLSLAGIYSALLAYKSTGVIRPILLWTTALYALLSWPVSGQLSAHAVGHIVLALAIRSLSVQAAAPSQS